MAAKGKTLQARVDEEFAKRFSAIAMARGMSDSDLVRESLEEKVQAATETIDDLRAALKREYEAAQRALDGDPPAKAPAKAPVKRVRPRVRASTKRSG